MKARTPNGDGHSATVEMSLQVNGYVLPIAQMGPNFLVLKNAIDHPPAATAQISLSIDGHVDRWEVSLPEGISGVRRKTLISRCQTNGSAVK